jgi:hypothetical protein
MVCIWHSKRDVSRNTVRLIWVCQQQQTLIMLEYVHQIIANGCREQRVGFIPI